MAAIGDLRQLQGIGPGGTASASSPLTVNRHERAASERGVLEVWHTGDHQAALQLRAAGRHMQATKAAERGQAGWALTKELHMGTNVEHCTTAEAAVSDGCQRLWIT
ncbi:hypothetical protein HW130_33910 [Streptomyces sp. PKU-EA00015]|uniref:hypothetical protein n=1 Tax=Streptomyces sp. PKU-EA00015 TaxID=2748326 RepID=UPI0015A2519D|nr:hypothetical protein [Streptomyces sp. PKU-EA00015]NWF31175.1 hypothetical protein [Streptomyces sp. PKU-EA00015]